MNKIYKCDYNNNYYKIVDNKSLNKISQKEYFEKTKYNIRDIFLLKNSIYPGQSNNYIMLKYPKWFGDISLMNNSISDTRNVPCDYKLVNIIKFLWKNKIRASGWNQPTEHGNSPTGQDSGFIAVKKDIYNNNDHFDKMLNFLNKYLYAYIIFIDHKNEAPGKVDRSTKYKNKIRCYIYTEAIIIYFSNSMLKNINKKLRLKTITKGNSLDGNIFINSDDYTYIFE
jgi:hypothetical protein